MIPPELEALVLADSVGALDRDERVELLARLDGLTPEQRSEVAHLYDIASSAYRRVATGGRTPNMLADGRHLVYDDEGTLRFLDTASGRSVEVLSVGPPSMTVNQRQFRITRDNRHLVFLRNEAQADIWLMSPE